MWPWWGNHWVCSLLYGNKRPTQNRGVGGLHLHLAWSSGKVPVHLPSTAVQPYYLASYTKQVKDMLIIMLCIFTTIFIRLLFFFWISSATWFMCQCHCCYASVIAMTPVSLLWRHYDGCGCTHARLFVISGEPCQSTEFSICMYGIVSVADWTGAVDLISRVHTSVLYVPSLRPSYQPTDRVTMVTDPITDRCWPLYRGLPV